MSKAYYDIYIGQVLALTHTLVIHSSATAAAINKGISQNPQYQAQGIGVDPTDPGSWKYYLNLQGQYHAIDTPMTVTSLDTLQTIPFTLTSLKNNKATAKAYAYGSSYYEALVARYPLQEDLIQGILNPVTFNKDANGQLILPEDGTILYYDPSLVEPRETNLIPRLQEWLYAVFARWDVRGYALVDDLYVPGHIGTIYAHIPSRILNIRLANCKTRFVHSFHVRQELASNGNLDAYVDSLSEAQQLWLYRNIQYLKRNAGKQSTFQMLVDNLLTSRGIPLAEWNMVHDTEHMPEDLLPTVEFERKPLNLGYSVTGQDTKSVQAMFELEKGVAKDNPTVLTEHVSEATTRMQNAPRNRLKTKVLESAITDLTDAMPYTFTDCLLNQWMYWAFAGRYTAVVNLTDPHTGSPFNLPVLDAFILYLYAYNQSYGIELRNVPAVTAGHVQRIPSPSATELKGLVNPALIGDEDIAAVLSVLPTIGTYISTEAFYNACLDVQAGVVAGRLLYTAKEGLHRRAQMEIITERCYCDVELKLGGESTISYTDWLHSKGYQFMVYSPEEWGSLAKQLIAEATGVDLLNNRNLKDLQASMLALMAQLSSYSVQYIQSINTSQIKVVDWNAVRVGNILEHSADNLYMDGMVSDVLALNARQREYLHNDLYDGEGLEIAFRAKSKMQLAVPLSAMSAPKSDFKYLDRFQMPIIRYSIAQDEVQPLDTLAVNLVSPEYVPLDLLSLSEGFNVTSVAEYLALTDAEREILRKRFLGALSTPISAALRKFILDGLKYPTAPTSDAARDPYL